MKRTMHRLLWIIAISLFIICFYWFAIAWLIEKRAFSWVDEQRALGRDAAIGAITVKGFPGQFATSISEISFDDKENGVAWRAPNFDFVIQALTPRTVFMKFPPRQIVTTPTGRTTITSQVMTGQARVDGGIRLLLAQALLEMTDVIFETEKGEARLEEARLFAQRNDEEKRRYSFDLHLSNIFVDLMTGFPAENIGFINITADVTLDRALALSDNSMTPPQPRKIKIVNAEALMGDIKVDISGALEIDADGTSNGEISVSATNWLAMLDWAQSRAVIPPDWAARIRLVLTAIGAGSDRTKAFSISVRFADGRSYIGPIPIAPAPNLHFR